MPHSIKAHAPVFKGANPIPMLIAFGIGTFIWIMPLPSGVSLKAWHLFAIFSGVITALIGKALPMGGVSILALTIITSTHTLSTSEALSGFAHPVIWLVVAAFFI